MGCAGRHVREQNGGGWIQRAQVRGLSGAGDDGGRGGARWWKRRNRADGLSGTMMGSVGFSLFIFLFN